MYSFEFKQSIIGKIKVQFKGGIFAVIEIISELLWGEDKVQGSGEVAGYLAELDQWRRRTKMTF
ncbi:hypothetical protein CCACVL1_21612 [Corchorus capsularis]|uniref:Uncharacterized protein n=1 Tax=Corchorus capsularis TaxID=210143 RepID=A0A1R3H3C4_COCAP|nr:hypothetical protein CCACVL1_21612 [Corchorus capsularis]